MRFLKSVIKPEDSNSGNEVVVYWSETAPIDASTGIPIKSNGRATLKIGDEVVHAVYRGRKESGFSGLHHYMLKVSAEVPQFEDIEVLAA